MLSLSRAVYLTNTIISRSIAVRSIPTILQTSRLLSTSTNVSETIKSNATTSAKESVEQAMNKVTQNVIENTNKLGVTTTEAPLPMRLGNKERYALIAPSGSLSSYFTKLCKVTGHVFTLTKEFIMHPSVAEAKTAKAWKATKNGLHHVWISTKLLGQEMSTGTKLLIKMGKGDILTRREKKQLTRATTDTLRMVPFSVFVIVPFMEFTLPFFLKFFPNMLPSTFESQTSKETKMQKSLETRLALASVFQDSLEQIAESKINDDKDKDSAADLLKVINECRQGDLKDVNEIIKLSQIFTDELTVDNMARPQLVTLCKFMNMGTFGPDEYLRIQLRNKIRHIMTDDLSMSYEGISYMNVSELRVCCQERGLITAGLKKSGYYSQLTEWLDYSVNKKIPITILLLANALSITSKQNSFIENISNSLSALNDDVIKEAIIEAAPSGDKIAKVIKLDRVQHENKKLKEEKTLKRIEESKEEKIVSSPSEQLTTVNDEKIESPVAIETTTPAGDDVNLTVKEVETIKAMASNSFVVNERETLQEIKNDVQTIAEDAKLEEPQQPLVVDQAITLLNRMLNNIEKDLNKLDTQIGTSKKILDHDADGIMHNQELVNALLKDLKATNNEEEARSIIAKMDHDKDGKVSLGNLEYILEKSYNKDEPLPTMEEAKEQREEEMKEKHDKTIKEEINTKN